MESDAAKRWRKLAGWIADGQGGRGLVPLRSSSRARQKLNGRVSYFLHEVGRGICEADFRDGGACKSLRNVLLREPVFFT